MRIMQRMKKIGEVALKKKREKIREEPKVLIGRVNCFIFFKNKDKNEKKKITS